MRSTEPETGMLCPLDKTVLVMSERQGIEIDYCPTCRGVWLDRGELDKIIERNVQTAAPPMAQPAAPSRQPGMDNGHQSKYSHGQPKRRKSFLEDLFD